MSNAFTNFLGGVSSGVFGNTADLKTFQHADRLYVKNNYARSPKLGFLYYVRFNINPQAVNTNLTDVDVLVKKIDLPKFTLTTETINQYNRKALVNTGLKYDPINIEFHDDNSDITTALWASYFQYYYADGAYSSSSAASPQANKKLPAFADTKYSTEDYAYGLDNFQNLSFFESIDIYVLHQQQYTQYTLVNPMVNSWQHDSLANDDGAKILTNKMSVSYEDVIYYKPAPITNGSDAAEFTSKFYDKTPSPLGVGGNGTNTVFGAGGVLSGANAVLGLLGKENKSPLDYLAIAIQGNQLSKNVRELSKAGIKQEGYSILTGVLRDVQVTGNQPGGIGDAIRSGNYGAAGNIGVNLFKNASIDGTQTANISNLITKGVTGL